VSPQAPVYSSEKTQEHTYVPALPKLEVFQLYLGGDGFNKVTVFSLNLRVAQDKYEPEILIGLVLQAVIFNLLMLPLSIWAMVRWKKLSPLSRYHIQD
jgi:hypothetical protein